MKNSNRIFKDLAWTKNRTIALLTVFLLSAFFINGCHRKGKDTREEQETNKMDAFVEKCNTAHEELVACMESGIVCPTLEPTLLYPPALNYSPLPETIREHMKECLNTYEKSTEESFKILSKEQMEKKQNAFAEFKIILSKYKYLSDEDIIKCRLVEPMAQFAFFEISKQKICSEYRKNKRD